MTAYWQIRITECKSLTCANIRIMVNEIQEHVWRGCLKKEWWNQNNLTLNETLCCFCRGIYRAARWNTKTEERLKTYTQTQEVLSKIMHCTVPFNTKGSKALRLCYKTLLQMTIIGLGGTSRACFYPYSLQLSSVKTVPNITTIYSNLLYRWVSRRRRFLG